MLARSLAALVTLALLVPAPGSALASSLPESVELIAPASCCCGDPCSELSETPAVANVCCCELTPAEHPYNPSSDPFTLAAPSADILGPVSTHVVAVQPPARAPLPAPAARAPPPGGRSLLSQHTSHLL